MEIKQENQELTKKLSEKEEIFIAEKISTNFRLFQEKRQSHLTEIKDIKNAIYNDMDMSKNAWNKDIKLPDIYELSQTLKSHLMDCLYSHPDAMFDVSGNTQEAQLNANKQKALLCNYFEKMHIENELEKSVDSIIEAGEATLFIGWQKKFKKIRRYTTLAEEFFAKNPSGFVVEEKEIYDGPIIKHVPSENFCFEIESVDNWDSCPKIFKTEATFDDIISNKSNNYLNKEKISELKNLSKNDKNLMNKKLEVLEFWGDITLENGEILKNWLIVIAENKIITRFEPNPFIINPFIHAVMIENSTTKRGISPLKSAVCLNEISSTIINKQLDALSLIINPPYLAPKGCFKGEQEVKPGKIIEYDSALMPQQPIPLHFEQALSGWEFIKFFKSQMESATGIYKDTSSLITQNTKTATEVNYSMAGQTTRLNMLIEKINRKLIIPMVEKTAQIITNFKFEPEEIFLFNAGKQIG